MVYRDDKVAAFMDLYPVNPGHTLVIPVLHAAYLDDLEPETAGWMFQVGQRIAAAIRRSSVRCEGINLFLADGEAAGQEVFHAHLHVVPRYRGDGFRLNHGPHSFREQPRAVLDAVAGDLRAALALIPAKSRGDSNGP